MMLFYHVFSKYDKTFRILHESATMHFLSLLEKRPLCVVFFTAERGRFEAYSFSTPFLVLSNSTNSQNIEKLFDYPPQAKQFACLKSPTEKASLFK